MFRTLRLSPLLIATSALLAGFGGCDSGLELDDEPIESSGSAVRSAPEPTGSMSNLDAAIARVRSGNVPAPVKITTGSDPGQGVLRVTRGEEVYELPLVHTEVDAEISGFVADVQVRQVYGNPFDEPIEAVYLFPLPDDAAVDDMEMRIGDRVIVAEIHERAEARQIYEAARDAGQAAALLEQERPNMFTQSVANILPGEAIEVAIHVVDPLQYEAGGYEWAFPMVVGPRFVPAQGTGASGGTSPGEDAARLDAPYSPDRTGNDIDLFVSVDAGLAIQDIRSPSHELELAHDDGSPSADVRLAAHDTIPNKDFIMRYDVAGEAPEAGLLTHYDPDLGGFFLMMIQPQADEFVTDDVVTPKEMVFVVDTSCSMSGYPLDKAKDAMELAIAEMNPDDRFYVMDFNSTVSTLSPLPLPNTADNRRRGLQYVRDFSGYGGTNMVEGIKASLDLEQDPELLRTVLFMTDGYIGNEAEILAAIEERLGDSRLYSFGVGSSVNRYLLDRMAKGGRGHVEYVRQDEDADEHVQAFYERIRNPLLTDVDVEWDGVEVLDVYPDPVPDLFAGQPIVLVGRYDEPGEGIVRVTGRIRGREHVQEIKVTFPGEQPEHAGLASLWARTVVEDLEARQVRGEVPGIVEEITELALQYRLMTRYTSFVAVEERIINEDGEPRRVRVPLETPDGVDHGAIFGEDKEEEASIFGATGGYQGYSSGSTGGLVGGSGSTSGMGGLGTRGSGLGGGGYGRGSGSVRRSADKKAKPSVSAPSAPPPARAPVAAAEDVSVAPDEPEPTPQPAATLTITSQGDNLDAGKLRQDLTVRVRQFRLNTWEPHLVDHPDAIGAWTVRLHLDRDGKVQRVEWVDDSVQDADLKSKFERKAKAWWLTAPIDGKAASVELKIVLAVR